jgi:MscS family membrane protein
VKLRVHPSETWLTFGLDRVDLLTHEFFEIPIWQYLAAFIYIFLAFYVSKFLDYATRVWLKRLTEKTETKLDDLLLDLIHGPVKIVSFVLFLYIGLRVFTWAEWMNEFLPKAFKLIVIVVIAYVMIKAIDLVLGMWKERSSADDKAFDDQLFPIIRKSLKAFVFVVTFLFICDNVFNQDIKAILTSLSIGGLAIGLAAQDTIANFFGAVVVFIDKPFRIGDRIKLDQVDGVVESIGMRSTKVRSLDGFLITVPNKTMGNATITNISRRPTIKSEINYGLTYDTTDEKLNRALEILRDVYRNHRMTHDVIVTFNRFGDSALNILVVHWWKDTDAKAQLAGMQEMNLAVKKRFEAEKINFAFPSQTVYLKQDSEWRLNNGEPKAKS